MTTWFISDTHFGHVGIIKYQPERLEILGLPADATIEEHDEALIARWNSFIAPTDPVYFLGDLSMGQRTINVPKTARLNGIKQIAAPGNHDNGLWPRSCKPEKVAEHRDLFRQAGWEIREVDSEAWGSRPAFGFTMFIADVRVSFSHLPLTGTPDHESTETRYEEYMMPDVGQIHVHGHSHGHNGRFHGRQLDVGADANSLAPTSFEEIEAWVRSIS